MATQDVADARGKPGVAGLELRSILGTVDPGEMEDEVRCREPLIELGVVVVDVQSEDFHIVPRRQVGNHVAADEASSPGNKNPHHRVIFLVLRASFTQSSSSSSLLMPSTSSRVVLWEL